MKMKKLLHGALALALTVALIVSSLVFAQAAGTVYDVASDAQLTSALSSIADKTEATINFTADFESASGMELYNKYITFTGDHTITFANDGLRVLTGSRVTIDGPTFVSQRNINIDSSAGTRYRTLVVWQGLCIIESGGITGNMHNQGGNSSNPSTLIINGGTFTQKNDELVTDYDGASTYNTIIINGGTFNSVDGVYANLILCEKSALYINDGTFSQPQYGNLLKVNGGTATINGGVFNANAKASGYTMIYAEKGTLTINGGDINATNKDYMAKGSANATVKFQGGVFNLEPSASYVASPFTKRNANNEWEVAADIASADDFTTAVGKGGTYYITADISLANATATGVGLNFKGSKTVSFTGKGLLMQNKANVTIDGPTFESTVDTVRGSYRTLVLWQTARCVINNTTGTTAVTGLLDNQGGNNPSEPCYLIINGGTFTQKGVAIVHNNNSYSRSTINGGTFTGVGSNNMIYNAYSGAKLTITGGANGPTFTKSASQTGIANASGGIIEISGGKYNFDPSDLGIVSGYEATLSGGIYTVDVMNDSVKEVNSFEELKAAIDKNIPEIIINTTIEADGRLGPIKDKTITFTGTGKVVFTATTKDNSEFQIFGGNNIVFDGPSFEVGSDNNAGRLIVIWGEHAADKVTINQGNFIGEIQSQTNSSLIINGGTFSAKASSSYADVIEQTGDSKLTINGGEFTSNGAGNALVTIKTASLTVENGTFNSSGTGNAFLITPDASVTVSGITINASNQGQAVHAQSGATLNLENVTVNNTGSGMTFEAYGNINILSGTYTVPSAAQFIDAGQVGTLNLTGGTYNFDPSTVDDLVRGDYDAKNNGDGTWTVSLARVIVDDFAALKQAIADNIPEIVINKEITATSRIDAMEDKNIKFTGEGTVKFTGTTDGTGGFHMRGGCNIVFDGPNFIVENNASRLLVIYQSGSYAAPNVTINKGTFTGEIQVQYKTILTINGGTFNTKNSNSYKNSVKLTTGEAVIINGGTFNATGSGSNAVWVEHNSDTSGQLTVMGGEFNASSSATAFYVNTSTVNSHSISNAVINVESGSTAINVGSGKTVTLKRVTVTNEGTFKAGSGTLNVVSGTYNFDPASYVDANVSSTKQEGDLYIVSRITGTPKMLRLTNGYNMNFSGYNFAAEATITAGQTYIFEIDYREFGGAGGLMFDLCYATTANGYNNGANKITPSEIDAVDGRYYRIEFTAPQGLRASSNFRLRIGQETLQLGTKDANGTLTNTYNYSTTIYVANVKLVNVNDPAENLIENGDFGYTPVGNITEDTTIEGWALYGIDNLTSVDVMNIPNGFFTVDDVADLVNEFDTAIVLQGGDRHTLQFKANLKPNTSYKFSYYYRSVGDLPKFEIRTDYNSIDIQDVTTNGAKDYFEKTYVITPGELANGSGHTRNRFCFELGHNSTDAVFYIAGLKLYELDAQGNPIGENIIGDYNPIFIDDYDFSAGNIVKQQLGQGDNEMMTNIVAHGWLGNFHKSSDGYNTDYEEDEESNPDAVHAGSNKYAGVAKVADNFFVYRAPGLYIRDGIFGKLSYDSVYDVYIDAKYDVLDLLIAKMEKMGYFGADFQTEILKNEILNHSEDLPETGTVVKVANGESLTNALNNASSGTTILLERGGEWRVPGTNIGTLGGSADEFTLKSGVNLGAYGTGAKPRIYGSVKNYSTSSWTKNGNIYSISLNHTGFGNIYLYEDANSTEPTIIGRIIKNGELFDATNQLTEPGDCYHNGKTFYVYLDKAPSNYARIEISSAANIIRANSNSTIDNISILYAGRHGITTNSGSDNVTIQNCEIAYIGGSTETLGNGIEFARDGDNLIAKHNYIYQCFDAGVTFQEWETTGKFNGVTIENNLLTNNFYNIEWWNDNTSSNSIQNVVIQNNILKDAGYCWSITQRPASGNDANFASNIYSGKETTSLNGRIKNVSIINNTFDHTRGSHICWGWYAAEDSATYPANFTAEGNVFYQETGSPQQSVQRFGQLDNGSFAFASSQAYFAEVMKAFDSTAFARWVVVNK